MDELNIAGATELAALDKDIDVGKALPPILRLVQDGVSALKDGRVSLFEAVRLGKDFLAIIHTFKRNKT